MGQRLNGSWDAYLASPANFAAAGVDDIITNLATKERESLGLRSNKLPNLRLLLVRVVTTPQAVK